MPLTYPCISLKWDMSFVYTGEPIMDQGAIFQSNRSQAIRLPKAVAFPDNVKRVDVVVLGKTRIITPAGSSWESWFDGPGATADFMPEREQPAEQQRESF